jgi:hypothetical protein
MQCQVQIEQCGRNRLDPPCDFLRSVLQVIDFFGTLSCHGLKTEGGSKRLRVAQPPKRFVTTQCAQL